MYYNNDLETRIVNVCIVQVCNVCGFTHVFYEINAVGPQNPRQTLNMLSCIHVDQKMYIFKLMGFDREREI